MTPLVTCHALSVRMHLLSLYPLFIWRPPSSFCNSWLQACTLLYAVGCKFLVNCLYFDRVHRYNKKVLMVVSATWKVKRMAGTKMCQNIEMRPVEPTRKKPVSSLPLGLKSSGSDQTESHLTTTPEHTYWVFVHK